MEQSRRDFLRVAAGIATASFAGEFRGAEEWRPPQRGNLAFGVERGVRVAEAVLRWEVGSEGGFQVVLETRTSGVVGWVSDFSEVRRSEGRRIGGVWRTERSVRERPGRAPETLVREGEWVVVSRKGRDYRYPAPTEAVDFVCLLWSLAEQQGLGRRRGGLTLLGTKGIKEVTFALLPATAVQLESGAEVKAERIEAQTADGEWRLWTGWRVGGTGAIPLVVTVTAKEEGTATYRLRGLPEEREVRG
ncbi:MAG: DUF3108 domain-containing protein [Hydrogenophilus sp.]|nr:DUF3108 domain-containing protein [Hydrogenophilus sp.]